MLNNSPDPGHEASTGFETDERTAQKEGNVDRKEFLKSACGLGVCGCALNLLGPADVSAATTVDVPDQRLAFARYQVAKMVGLMAAGTAAPACAEILQQTGRECARLGQLTTKFKGDPEGYFATSKKSWGTDFSWDKEKGIVTVAVPEGECNCPLVDNRRTPAFFCNCSVGYQKEAFEAIFGKPVQVSLKESKLSGSKRCVFEVSL
jgi:predicted hydrocarbon binding protein